MNLERFNHLVLLEMKKHEDVRTKQLLVSLAACSDTEEAIKNVLAALGMSANVLNNTMDLLTSIQERAEATERVKNGEATTMKDLMNDSNK